MVDTIFKDAVLQSMEDFVPPSNYQLDCFVTNEVAHNDVLSRCMPVEGTTGTFLGVGPCQNFTYIGALKPRLACIVDARMDNLLEHLIFKLFIEQAETPLQYLGLLFSREVPADSPSSLTPESLVAALDSAPVSENSYQRNLAWLKQEISRRWSLTGQYLDRIDYLRSEFYRRQLNITNVNEFTHANLDQDACLRDVILARNSFGVNMHFLANIDSYSYVRELQLADRIIPVLGNLTSGPTIDRINEILSEHGEELATVYISNIEEHLLQRYQIVDGRVSAQPNPEGLLRGEFEDSYQAMVGGLAQLATEADALLIRFFFPGQYGGRVIGAAPHLQSDVRLLRRFIQQIREDKPRSVFETYL